MAENIDGIMLDDILLIMGITTEGITVLADLLDLTKIFPNSFSTFRVNVKNNFFIIIIMKIAVLFWNYGPYHVARVNALALKGFVSHEVIGIEVATRQHTYAWQRPEIPDTFNLITLFPQAQAAENIPYLNQVIAMWKCLNQESPDVLAICGYKDPVMLAALLWARAQSKVTILLSESKKDDYARNKYKEWVKSAIVRRFDAALVGGSLQKAYIAELGIPQERIWVGYDVIDNHFFEVKQSFIHKFQ